MFSVKLFPRSHACCFDHKKPEEDAGQRVSIDFLTNTSENFRRVGESHDSNNGEYCESSCVLIGKVWDSYVWWMLYFLHLSEVAWMDYAVDYSPSYLA